MRKQRRKKFNTHPHFLGKGGYEAKRTKSIKKDPLANFSISESIDPSIVSDDCNGRGYD